MSKHHFRPSARLLAQTATIVLVAALAGACSGGVERFDDPIFTGNTDNQRALLHGKPAEQPGFDALVAGPDLNRSVQRSALPPATGGSNATTTGSIPNRRPVATAPAKPVTQARSVTQTRPVATVPASSVAPDTAPRTVRGWTTAGGTQVSARAGDTVKGMSRRYGIPPYVLADINGVSADATFPAGQRVTIPTYVHGAPSTTTAASQPVRLPPAGGSPSVTGSIPVATRAVANAPIPQHKPGARPQVATLQVPASSEPSRQVTSAHPKRKPALSSARSQPVAEPKGATVQKAAVREAPETAPTRPIQVTAEQGDPNTRRFRWPAKGRIISDYGSKPGGSRNDGINLALPEGADIKAVEDGTVIYSGNELKGYGNLVLVRHDDGWVSAYAHASELLVKRGDPVRRGQTIAKVGATGSVTQPQLHFELRRGNKAVDPMKYLASL
uniref:murein hydrolase activator EnvC family protein n=1 Tax=Stappia sp. TaxID=1870903 RepID=UPI003BA8C549